MSHLYRMFFQQMDYYNIIQVLHTVTCTCVNAPSLDFYFLWPGECSVVLSNTCFIAEKNRAELQQLPKVQCI